MKSKLAICVIAYNEDKNIAFLIKKILRSGIDDFSLFIYTDGSIDNTAEIASFYQLKYPTMIKHVNGNKRMGKVYAFNYLMAFIKKYEYAIFLDADIDFSKSTLLNLYKFLKSHPEIEAASPLSLAYIKNLTGIQRTIAELYSKARIHAANFKRFKYLSGRAYCIRTKSLLSIPPMSYFEDLYLNLNIPYENIAICKNFSIRFMRPTTLKDFVSYNFRLGRALGSIRRNYTHLWKEQMRRISVIDYAIFDLTKYKFLIFFRKLKFSEKIIFLYTRLLAILGMYSGLIMYKPSTHLWHLIESTKVSYGSKWA